MQQTAADTASAYPEVGPKLAASDGTRYLISDLCLFLETYLPQEQVREVYRAYLFGAEAHEGQKRMSGEPYIYHPVAVARILAGMRMDHKCLMAAILHDVIEDTETAKDQLTEICDAEIAELVDGVSKLTAINFRSKAEAQAALNAMTDSMTDALARNETISLVGFGTFSQRHRAARQGKNPQTGAPLEIKASNNVAFKPGKALKDALNG